MKCKTGKVRYRDELTAKVVLVSCRARAALRRGRSGQKRHEGRAYRCPFCYGWHLTSKPRKGAA